MDLETSAVLDLIAAGHNGGRKARRWTYTGPTGEGSAEPARGLA